jgi:hypothetical protein
MDKMKSDLDDDEIDFDDEDEKVSSRTRRRRLRELRQFLNESNAAPHDDDNAERNVGFACEEFNLDCIDKEILILLIRYGRVGGLEEFADKVFKVLQSASRAVAALIGKEVCEVHQRLASQAW